MVGRVRDVFEGIRPLTGENDPVKDSPPQLTYSSSAASQRPISGVGTADFKPEQTPRMSCCYGLMVFMGLVASLLTLTLMVIYAGFWTQQSLYGNKQDLKCFLSPNSASYSFIQCTE